MHLSNDRIARKNGIQSTELLESRRLFAFTTVLSSTGVLTITGSSGADNIVVAQPHSVITITEPGSSTSGFRPGTVKKIVVNLGAGADKFASNDSFTIPMTINGGSGKDFIISGGGADVISGGDDNDTILGGNGNDNLSGNAGNDRIDDGADKDSVYGGSGNDEINPDPYYASADYYDGGEGTDSIQYSRRSAGVIITNDGVANDGKRYGSSSTLEHDNVLPSIEVIRGTYYNDKIKLTGNINNTIDGLAGDDAIDAGPGNDTVSGNYGNDNVNGGTGDDKINDSSGLNYLNGNEGNDSVTGGEHSDTILGSVGKDTLSGGKGNDYLYGQENDDVISGGDGNDTLFGGSGNDFLFGDAGFDRFEGNSGNDTIYARDGVFDEYIDGGADFDIAYIDRQPVIPFTNPGDKLVNIETWA